VVFDAAGEEITFEAKQNSRAVLLSCQSLDEAIAGSDALVMNTEDQLIQARARLQSGMFGEISDVN
jgi:redox-sensitive bicupin YhaK (pirin superfamily)